MGTPCPLCHDPVPEGMRFCPRDGAPVNPEDDPIVGQVFAERYEVVRPIGEGGMGVVYEGIDREDGSRVAIKLLHQGMLAVEQAVKRFEREGKVTARLDHENIVRMKAFGETDAGAMYLVMEFAEGVPLGAVLADGRFPPERAIDVGRQILTGLKVAHEHGIIHRDLKPDNVMLCPHPEDPEREVVKILDFGIAKILDSADAEQLTRTGMVFGTPEYMSPEQGVGQKVDHRADIYAAGVLLYEMACGVRPFDSEDKIQIIAKQISVVPPKPTERVEGVEVPSALEGAIMMALEKKPEGRFQTAEDFLGALDIADRAVRGSGPVYIGIAPTVASELPADSSAAEEPRRAATLNLRGSPAGSTTSSATTQLTMRLGVLLERIPSGRRGQILGGAAALCALALGAVLFAALGGGEDGETIIDRDLDGALSSLFEGSSRAVKVPDQTRDPDDFFDELPVANDVERRAVAESRVGRTDAVLTALAGAPDSPTVRFLRGRALAYKGRWGEAKPHLLDAFARAPVTRRDRALLDAAIAMSGKTGKMAVAARTILEGIGTDGAVVIAEGMFVAHDEAGKLGREVEAVKASGGKVTPEQRKALGAARRMRKVLRRVLERSAPGAVDLSPIWVAELAETRDCGIKAGLIKRIREHRVVEALPVLEEMQASGTGFFSGNRCIRGVLPATIKELSEGG